MANSVRDQLKQLQLSDVVVCDDELGRGAYGYVLKLKLKGLMCAGKHLHSSYFDSLSPKDRSHVIDVFCRECIQHSKLNHPNIVQCLGVHLPTGSDLPILVMEYMPFSLSRCLEKYPGVPSGIKYSILLGVSAGLAYLHGHSPPIVHRDLTANNVLVSEVMHAKIADFGVSRIIDADKRLSTLTKAPGTPVYMPPEALIPQPVYNKSLDIFSFGVLVMHVAVQEIPLPQVGPTKVDQKDPSKLIAISEIDRRASYFEEMGDEPHLQSLVRSCLKNDPKQRPSIEQVISRLEELVPSKKQLSPFENTIEAVQLLQEAEESKDILHSDLQVLQSFLTSALDSLKSKGSLSNVLDMHNLKTKLQSATEIVSKINGEKADINHDNRLLVRYKHPAIPSDKCFLHLSLARAQAPDVPIVIHPPVNMPFRGIYIDTVASNLVKAYGVAAAKDGRVFVVDNKGWDSVLAYNKDNSSTALLQSSRMYQRKPPELSSWYPTYIAVLEESVLIIADTGNRRLIKLRIPEHPSGVSSLLAKTDPDLFPGSDSNSPKGVAVSKEGVIVTCDRANHQIVVLSDDLRLVKKFGSEGTGPTQFRHPYGAAFDSKSNLYVSDCSNSCIKVFDQDFAPIRTIGGPGNTQKNLRGPAGLCIDTYDYLYVVDMNHQRVFVFDPAGNFRMNFGSYGYGKGQFYRPLDVAITGGGLLYVSDGEGKRVQVFA